MTQDRIYLTLKKEPGEPAQLVDQHGRIVAGVRTCRLEQGCEITNVLHIEIVEKTARGRPVLCVQQAEQ